MPAVHPTAILEGDVTLGDEVSIGPHCVISGSAGPVTIGRGCTLIGNVYLHGPLMMAERNVVYPFACLGFAPQHARFDPNKPGPGTRIGNGNTFREHTTVHRAFTDEHATVIGDRNYFMTTAHVGHDSVVGNDCTFVTNSALGGHAVVQDRVTIGGGAMVHQFARVGRGAMLSGLMGLSNDLPPWFMLTGTNVVGGINVVGLRRNGFSHADVDAVRWVYRMLYRSGLSRGSALQRLREREAEPLIAEYLAFIGGSKRGIATGRPKPMRGAGESAAAAGEHA